MNTMSTQKMSSGMQQGTLNTSLSTSVFLYAAHIQKYRFVNKRLGFSQL